LISNEFLIDDIINAVDWMSPQRALHLKNGCIENAKNYRSERFFKQMDALLGAA